MQSNMSLTHFSANPVTLDRERIYSQVNQSSGLLKPNGLWLSVDNQHDWEEWCRSEGWGVQGLKNTHHVSLSPGHGVLIVSTVKGIDDLNKLLFDESCGFAHRKPRRETQTTQNPIQYWERPNWERIAKMYQGVIISPYQPRRRYDILWYYGWDCASGCIWDLNAIDMFCETQKRDRDGNDQEIT